MDPKLEEESHQDWDGVEQRETRRRYTLDRRKSERKKRYWWSVIFPIILGTGITALISWGVYVTHTTYRISANYEKTFVQHIDKETEREAQVEHKLEVIRTDYTNRIDSLKGDMTASLKDIKDMQILMYRLLLNHQWIVNPQRDPPKKSETIKEAP